MDLGLEAGGAEVGALSTLAVAVVATAACLEMLLKRDLHTGQVFVTSLHCLMHVKLRSSQSSEARKQDKQR